MRPGIVMVSNYVAGSSKDYSGIIDYYERYEEKNENKTLVFEDREKIFLAYEKKVKNMSEKEVNIINQYEEYQKQGGNKDFIEYVKEGMNEKEVSYGNYINYMNKDIKSSGLFGDKSNHFSLDEKMEMKLAFDEGQKNGSVLWGNVYSFDNEFLKKHNLMDERTGHVNELKIKQAVKESINVMLKEEKLDKSAVWCGEIHYDTDNIHVHTSIVEMKNTRPIVKVEKMKKISSKEYERTGEYEMQPKAKIKKKTIDNMKSTFANKLIDRTVDLQLISDRRYQLHHSISLDRDDKVQKEIMMAIKNNLPENKKDWQYNNKKMDHVRPLIDKYTENHLNKHHKKDYDEYKELLKKEEEFYKEIYGEGQTDRYKDYSKNKIQELKSRTGNALLKEIKEEKKIEYSKSNRGNQDMTKLKGQSNKKRLIDREEYKKQYNHPKGQAPVRFKRPVNLFRVNNAVKKTLRSEKRNRELEYEHTQLQQNVERERQRQGYER